MSTKFYLLYKTTELDFFAAGSSWANHDWGWQGSLAYYGQLIDPIKAGYPYFKARIQDNGTSVTPPYNHLHYRGISRKLMPQTISGTLDVIFHVQEDNAAADCYTRLYVYVIDTTGNPFGPPVKAYFVNNYQETLAGGGIEWSYGTGSTFTSRRLQATVNIPSYTVPNDSRDYRIVIEIGCRKYGTTGYNETAIYAGARNYDFSLLPDLTVSPLSILGAPYLEFSADIALKALNYPPGDEPESAIDMGAGPITVNPVGDSLAEYYKWYKYTQNNTKDRVNSSLFCSPGTPGNNYANLYTYSQLDPVIDGPPFAIGQNSIHSNGKRSVMTPLKANCNLYLKTYLSGGAAGGNIGTLTVTESPGPVSPGDIMVNVDSGSPSIYDPTIAAGNGSVWWKPTGEVSYVDAHVSYSEIAVSLANGKFAVARQQSPYELLIYDKAPSIAILHRVPLAAYPASLATDMKSFYVATTNNYTVPPIIYKISDEGVINAKSWELNVSAGDQIKNFGISRDGKIAYIVSNDEGWVHRHDLENDIPLAPFLNKPLGAWAGDIIVLSDNTILTWFDAASDVFYHYAPDGTVLHTWSLAETPAMSVDHIVHETDDDPTKFWAWLQYGTGYRFKLYNVSDGSMVKQFDTDRFTGPGVSQKYYADCNPPVRMRFGVGNSCAFISMMNPPIPPDVSGIYFINPEKVTNHDSYYGDVEKKIPDPTIRTGLMGE